MRLKQILIFFITGWILTISVSSANPSLVSCMKSPTPSGEELLSKEQLFKANERISYFKNKFAKILKKRDNSSLLVPLFEGQEKLINLLHEIEQLTSPLENAWALKILGKLPNNLVQLPGSPSTGPSFVNRIKGLRYEYAKNSLATNMENAIHASADPRYGSQPEVHFLDFIHRLESPSGSYGNLPIKQLKIKLTPSRRDEIREIYLNYYDFLIPFSNLRRNLLSAISMKTHSPNFSQMENKAKNLSSIIRRLFNEKPKTFFNAALIWNIFHLPPEVQEEALQAPQEMNQTTADFLRDLLLKIHGSALFKDINIQPPPYLDTISPSRLEWAQSHAEAPFASPYCRKFVGKWGVSPEDLRTKVNDSFSFQTLYKATLSCVQGLSSQLAQPFASSFLASYDLALVAKELIWGNARPQKILSCISKDLTSSAHQFSSWSKGISNPELMGCLKIEAVSRRLCEGYGLILGMVAKESSRFILGAHAPMTNPRSMKKGFHSLRSTIQAGRRKISRFEKHFRSARGKNVSLKNAGPRMVLQQNGGMRILPGAQNSTGPRLNYQTTRPFPSKRQVPTSAYLKNLARSQARFNRGNSSSAFKMANEPELTIEVKTSIGPRLATDLRPETPIVSIRKAAINQLNNRRTFPLIAPWIDPGHRHYSNERKSQNTWEYESQLLNGSVQLVQYNSATGEMLIPPLSSFQAGQLLSRAQSLFPKRQETPVTDPSLIIFNNTGSAPAPFFSDEDIEIFEDLEDELKIKFGKNAGKSILDQETNPHLKSLASKFDSLQRAIPQVIAKTFPHHRHNFKPEQSPVIEKIRPNTVFFKFPFKDISISLKIDSMEIESIKLIRSYSSVQGFSVYQATQFLQKLFSAEDEHYFDYLLKGQYPAYLIPISKSATHLNSFFKDPSSDWESVELTSNVKGIRLKGHSFLIVEDEHIFGLYTPPGTSFQLLDKIGSGGQGDIYLSYSHKLGKLGATKIAKYKSRGRPIPLIDRASETFMHLAQQGRLDRIPEEDDEAIWTLRSFLWEMNYPRKLRHPSIIPLLESKRVPFNNGFYDPTLSTYDRDPFLPRSIRSSDFIFTNEFVKGISLEDYIEEVGRLSEGESLKLIKKLCEAVLYLHQNGIVHADLKPQNILLTIGEDSSIDKVFILDFGLSSKVNKMIARDRDTIAGSVPYIAPEVWQGSIHSRGARIDTYALGAIAYELLYDQSYMPILTQLNVGKAYVWAVTQGRLRREYGFEKRDEIIRILMGMVQKIPQARWDLQSQVIPELEKLLD